MIGGAERQSMYLSDTLSKYHNTYLVVLHSEHIDTSFSEFIKQKDIKVINLRGNLFQKIVGLYSFFKKKKIDLVFSYLSINNLLGGIIGRIAGVKYIVGGFRSSKIGKFKLIIGKFLHNHISDYTVFNNNAGAENLISAGFNPEKVKVINNCYYLNENDRINSVSGKAIIISVGRFQDVKDYKTAINCMNILKNKYRLSFEYRICGYGKNETAIREQIKKLNLGDCITVHIKPDNLMDLYRTSNIYLSTSLYEGFSNSVMEALSFSLPVVCTDVGDNSLMVVNEENGYRHKVGDTEAISESLHKIVVNPDMLRAMGNKSYSILKENYTEEPFLRKYLELINELTSS